MAEEEQKEIVPDDGGIVESVPKAPTETPVTMTNTHTRARFSLYAWNHTVSI